jgi:RNA polymerase sigma-70 factor, ECF subfamily
MPHSLIENRGASLPARPRFRPGSDADQLDRRKTDAAAVAAAAGDRQAFAYLYARHARDVQAYARWIVQDEHEAEDITQHVFLKLMTVFPKYDPTRARFEAWILRVTRNAAIDHLRHNRAVVGIPVEERSGARTPDPGTAASLRSVLDALNESQREVLVMHQLLGMPYSEVATRLGKTSGAVHTLYHRARLAAKRGLTDLEIGPVAKAQPAEGA